ncbi:DUF4422 domain-containing protein [Roseisalinus antarcticus]|uniref:General stress protein A n=1 Tax=Roseisalinus antarcticus TaxID=254357 RepID=A0A1Y5TSE5_9RHOB|nr:DUF4422 domain-containing protein [Roseisalinus antarcticus]SLN69080.1 General stress protein A [Roseisalinus antarcticus]
MQATLYSAYHKPAPRLSSRSVRPIHVGAAGAKAPLPDMIGDDTGDNISDRNAAYCELTALWWAWKNDKDSTHLGLLHYRRVLDFAQDHHGPTAELFLGELRIPDWLDATEAWLDANPDIDVVVPKAHRMGATVRENYLNGHAPGDFDRTRAILAEDHPDYLPAFDAVAAGHEIRLGNMGLMRRDLFERYCAFLFPVLERLEASDIDRTDYNAYQSRYLGFVAERLFTVFLHRLRTEEPARRIHEVHILNIGQALVLPYISDDSLNGPEHVNIAFSADRAYVPHAAAMLRSVIDHMSRDRVYNLFFLHSDVDDYALELLRGMIAGADNVHLHEIPAGNRFSGAYRSKSRAPSNATYNRFLLFDLLPTLDRLLYLDVDMIACGDVAEIFDTDMGGAQIAAVPDWIMTRTLTGPTPTIDPDVPDLGVYQRTRLGLEDRHIRVYFNAGLILFDFAAMDVAATGRALMARAGEGKYLFRDQDILNAHFKDSYLPLPARMNVFNTDAPGYGRVPLAGQRAALAAKRDPLVIHYAAGDYKPWNAAPVPFAEHYWAALIRTPFYAEVIAAVGKPTGPWRDRLRARVRDAGRALLLRAPGLRPVVYKAMRVLGRLGPPGRRGR